MRLCLSLCCNCVLLACGVAFAGTPASLRQPFFFRSSSGGSLNLMVGFRGGVNFSQPYVLSQNEVLQGNDPAAPYEKDYAPLFANLGYHYAFMVMVPANEHFSFSVEPSMASYNYRYTTTTGWTNGTDPTDYIEYEARHRNQVTYLEIPVVLRYAFGGNAIQPFLSLGLTYGYRLTASKKTETTVTRYTGSVSIPYENDVTIQYNAGSYIHSRFGIAPGIGFTYPAGPVILMLSADFNIGLNNIVDESGRYSNPSTTSGLYDVQDDLRLSVLNLNLGILFPTGMNQGGSSSGGKRQGGKAVECVNPNRKRK